MFEDLPYEHPLIWGTGGGNDIVSATLVLADVCRAGKTADLAGMCSPGAWHTYDGKPEDCVNRVTAGTRRFIPSRNLLEKSFVDHKVPELLSCQGFQSKVYNFSSRFGTQRLVDDVTTLIRKENYDGIIAVDVGGDILARGNQDPTILSPLMDFTTLYVLSQLNIPSTLVEFGLQTDGELRPQGCAEILDELQSTGVLTSTRTLLLDDPAVHVFRSVYDGIKDIRHGHTAHMTLQTLTATDDIHTHYHTRVQAMDKKWHVSFPLTLEKKYFGQMFLIDAQRLAASRPLAFPYKTPLEQCVKSKLIVNTSSEMDGLYASVEDSCVWVALYPQTVAGDLRKEVLAYGFSRLEDFANAALVWKEDEALIPFSVRRQTVGPFTVAGTHKIEQVVIELDRILAV